MLTRLGCNSGIDHQKSKTRILVARLKVQKNGCYIANELEKRSKEIKVKNIYISFMQLFTSEKQLSDFLEALSQRNFLVYVKIE